MPRRWALTLYAILVVTAWKYARFRHASRMNMETLTGSALNMPKRWALMCCRSLVATVRKMRSVQPTSQMRMEI
jgi:hypothetical protein